MKTVLNVMRLALSGFWLFLGHLLAGVILGITIIGIPFGIVPQAAASRSGRLALR